MERPSLHGVLVFVPDLEVARAFYCDVLGFELRHETDDHLELLGDDFELTLFPCESGTALDGYSSQASSSVVLAVTDLTAGVERLRGSGVTILHDEPAVGPIGRYVAFCDPFDTVHELVDPKR